MTAISEQQHWQRGTIYKRNEAKTVLVTSIFVQDSRRKKWNRLLLTCARAASCQVCLFSLGTWEERQVTQLPNSELHAMKQPSRSLGWARPINWSVSFEESEGWKWACRSVTIDMTKCCPPPPSPPHPAVSKVCAEHCERFCLTPFPLSVNRCTGAPRFRSTDWVGNKRHEERQATVLQN